MKEEILKLRSEGKTYNEITKMLGCSKGTISYHCGKGQKEKTQERQNRRRDNCITLKTDNFKYNKRNIINNVKSIKNFKGSVVDFQKRDNTKKWLSNKELETTFTWKDVIDKFGEDTVCYLSGEKINLLINTYNFDHIIPASKGGLNTFDNLGILTEKVNKMKSDMTPDELIEMCVKILTYNGYKISKE